MFPSGYYPPSYYPIGYYPRTVAVAVHGSGGGGVDTKGFQPWNKDLEYRKSRKALLKDREGKKDQSIATLVVALLADDVDLDSIFDQDLGGLWHE